ncbi:MAG: glycosyltransferase [Firmicutes bacterium]|nr:glycosyltransferase [Bacillota bacterium]
MSTQQKLVSIIVPIYNVEDHIRKCVNSILKQTYTNIEIILVDDGSNDKSSKICDEYAQLDDRIKVIHKENGGVSSARNAGLSIANGKYIGFVDADDWIDIDMYEYLVQSIESNNCDIACCGYYKEHKGITEIISKSEDMIIESLDENLDNFIEGSYEGSVWNKLFVRSIINHEFDTKISIGEDAYFLYNAIKNAKRIVYKRDPKYHYFIRFDSATNVHFNAKRFDTINSVDKIYNDITINFPNHAKKAEIMVFNKYLAILNLMLYYDADFQYEFQYSMIIEKLLNLGGKIKFSNHPSKQKYLAYRLFRFNKKIYRLIIKLYYKNKLCKFS